MRHILYDHCCVRKQSYLDIKSTQTIWLFEGNKKQTMVDRLHKSILFYKHDSQSIPNKRIIYYVIDFNFKRREFPSCDLQLKCDELLIIWFFPDTSVINLHSNASVQTIPLVLIVSMMRSGTTFTGEVFRSYPESFYLFEPMQFLTNNIGINNITFVNGTTRCCPFNQL